MKTNDMTPLNVGAPQLIPQGNVSSKNPGSFGEMQKSYYASATSSKVYKSRCGFAPGFAPGFTTFGAGNGDWQTMTRGC